MIISPPGETSAVRQNPA